MMKKAINIGTPVGPYSPGLLLQNGSQKTLFVSGQIPIDSTTGELISFKIEDQVKQVFSNLSLILDEAGFDFGDIVKVTIFMTDLANFSLVNDEYRKHFSEPYPARSTVQVGALPKGALIEIEAIAIKPSI